MPIKGVLQSLLILSLCISSSLTTTTSNATANLSQQFKEAPEFYNSPNCPSLTSNYDTDKVDDDDNNKDVIIVCSEEAVHVAMTLDATYLRGSLAAILSVLHHSSCPQNIFFHFITSSSSASASASNNVSLRATVSASFPYLKFQIYPFSDSTVAGLISTSIRSALDCPLNYARSYLANILPLCVRRVVYLDSDVVLVDDIAKLAATPLGGNAVLAAPEYCEANFTSYFTPAFWSNPSLSLTFANRKACYFNTGKIYKHELYIPKSDNRRNSE